MKKEDIFIPKKIWSIKKEKFLTFKEIINSEIINYSVSAKFEKAGLFPVENTPQEILDLAIEMNQRIDGTWEGTEEDEELQNKFKSFYKPNIRCYGFPSRIGAQFLRENKWMLG